MKKSAFWNLIRAVLFLLLIILILLMIMFDNSIQGKSKLINYAGMVRGGSQLIVKNELAGQHADAYISKIDDILKAMNGSDEKYKLPKLNDDAYQSDLYKETEQWNTLKKKITAYRKGSVSKTNLNKYSDVFFKTSDKTVIAAADSSEKTAKDLQAVETIVILVLLTLVVSYIGRGRELIKLARKNRKLDRMAYIDQGTDLPNARRCLERLSDERPIQPDVKITCFMFDLNNLKETNDEYGHEEGNVLLARFAACLKRAKSEHTFVGRFGGDEFIAVAVGISPEGASDFLDKIDENIRESNKLAKVKISYARGFAMSIDYPGYNIKELMDAADKAMYKDKMMQKQSNV